MRKEIQPKIESLFCDDCGKRVAEFDANLSFNFGYESKFDLQYGQMDFCHKCAEKFYKLIHKNYKGFKLEEH